MTVTALGTREIGPREVLRALPIALYTTDVAGRITFYNEAAAALWGYKPELGKCEWCGSWQLYWPDGRMMRHDECPMAIALKEKRAINGAEIMAVRPDGSRIPLLAYPTPLCDEFGTLLGGVNVLVDITDRKEVERSAQRLAAIVESSNDAIITKNPNGIITTWNPAAERLFGFTADEAVGLPVEVLIPPERHEEEALRHKRACAGEWIRGYETVRRQKNGSLIDVSVALSPIKNARGWAVSVSEIVQDIRDRKKAEDANWQLAAIVGSSNDAIMSLDGNDNITTWNRGAERLYGYAGGEVIGKTVMIIIPPDRRDEEMRILEALRKGERIEHYETLRRRKDGSLVNISLTLSPIKDAEGKIIGASKIARDITERKQAEEKQRLLFREMNHRIKNLFTLAGSMLTLCARFAATPQDLAESVRERLVALARAHDLTLPSTNDGEIEKEKATSLPVLVQTILAPYARDRASVAINGPDLCVSSKAITGLALFLNELATNATKYGALSRPDGCVDISWCVPQDELLFRWLERGGPRVEGVPQNEGFGSLLARLAVSGRLGGKISRDWNPEGLIVKLSVPLERLSSQA